MKRKIFSVCTVVFVLLLAVAASHSFTSFFSKHATVQDVNGEIKIPLSEISDGSAHYYRYKEDGQAVDFFVIKSDDGIVRAAFDACDVCFRSKKGYTQDGDYMVCENCGRKFHSSRINVIEGGCNPAPLTRTERGENLVITTADVLRGAKYF